MKVEIYCRPYEAPQMAIADSNVRIFYADQWVDFRDSEITICDHPEGVKPNEKG